MSQFADIPVDFSTAYRGKNEANHNAQSLRIPIACFGSAHVIC